MRLPLLLAITTLLALTCALDLKAEWEKAWCRGSKLTMGMMKSEVSAATFITPVRSHWDGDLITDFRVWGYRERPGHRNDLCDFGPDQHNLARAFRDMGIETTSSADGGPNKCFHVEHMYGATVEMKPDGGWPAPGEQWYTVGNRRLRETEAYTTLGINAPSGALYFFNRLSPLEAAHENWGVPRDKVPKTALPDLSSSSDHAWGFWNREHSEANIGDINKIFMCMITNDVTLALIDEAIKTYPLPPGTKPEDRPRGVEKWPGTTFEMHYDAAQVLLGSPNGQAAGYFLAQHKHRFGKSKTVEKVTVFRPDKGMMPYLLFWVIDAPPDAAAGEPETEDGSGNATEMEAQDHVPVVEQLVEKRSQDGKNVLREYVVRARL